MQFEFIVSAEVERLQGKFASRDEIEEALLEAIDSANSGTFEGSEGGEYEVTTWDINATPTAKQVKAAARKRSLHAPVIADAGPGIGSLIYAYVRLEANPEDEATLVAFEETMQHLLRAFPRVAEQARAAAR